MTADDIAALRTQLQVEEGTRLLPYTDTRGKITIGTGRNLTDRGISPDEAELMLTNDITIAAQALARRVPWFVMLDPTRQRALVDLTFNLGIGGVCGFVQMLDALNHSDYVGAAHALAQSVWATEVQPSRRDRLVSMIRTGQAQSTLTA